MEKHSWCAVCQAFTVWVKIGKTLPSGGSWLTDPVQHDLLQCTKCKEVESTGEKRSRPAGWSAVGGKE